MDLLNLHDLAMLVSPKFNKQINNMKGLVKLNVKRLIKLNTINQSMIYSTSSLLVFHQVYNSPVSLHIKQEETGNS